MISFSRMALVTANSAGWPGAFVAAFAVGLMLAFTGPLFGFSDTWQLVINTGTTIVTFLMVFLIQNALNRDTQALHLKLDKLIRVTERTKNLLIALEKQEEETALVTREINDSCAGVVPASGG